MKTLENHIILFDAECPICKVYTKAFVKSGMLEKHGRLAYQTHANDICPMVDMQRAVNEIALVDLKNGEVIYGVKSLFKIIGNSFTIFKPLFLFGPFIWIASIIYAFISYNRRVIVPATGLTEGFNIQPSFKRNYRIAYLFLTWFCTGYILTAYAHLLIGVVPIGNTWREYLICGGQIIFQGTIISFYAKGKFWDYLGNMMTISFGGSLLLLLLLILSHWFQLPSIIYAIYFMGVAGLMFLEHIRRTKLLRLGWLLTISWAFYRAVLLILILFV